MKIPMNLESTNTNKMEEWYKGNEDMQLEFNRVSSPRRPKI